MSARLLLGLIPLAGLLVLPELGCGHCDGAIRKMRAQRAEWAKRRGRGGCRKGRAQASEDPNREVRVRPDETFRIRGDGPKRSSAELLRLSGVGPQSWLLLDDRTLQPVPAEVSADAGGHMCLHGVGFNLRPRAPLQPGSYTMVLYLDRVRWPLVAVEDRVSYKGRPALVRRFRVEP